MNIYTFKLSKKLPHCTKKHGKLVDTTKSTPDLAMSILAGKRYIALLSKVRRAIFSLPTIVNKSR